MWARRERGRSHAEIAENAEERSANRAHHSRTITMVDPVGAAFSRRTRRPLREIFRALCERKTGHCSSVSPDSISFTGSTSRKRFEKKFTMTVANTHRDGPIIIGLVADTHGL